MTQQQEQPAAPQEIRNLTKRSSRFVSWSGLSRIIVGLVALANHPYQPTTPGTTAFSNQPDALERLVLTNKNP